MRKGGERERKVQEWSVTQWSLGLNTWKLTYSTHTKSQCSKYCRAKKNVNTQVKKWPKCYSAEEQGFLNLEFLSKNTKSKAQVLWCTRSGAVFTNLYFSNWPQMMRMHIMPTAGNHWYSVFPYWKKYWNVFIIIMNNCFAKFFLLLFTSILK